MKSLVAGAILMTMAVVTAVGSQQRDVAAPPVSTSASIAGIVIDDQQPPHPVRRAVVTLTGEGLRPNRGAITDDDGRFAIRDLPPGRFMLMAERGGYVTSVYGAKRPARPGNDVAVAAGQAIDNLQLRLWRGAVISGVVRDAFGAPLSNHAVDVVPARDITPTGLTLSNRGQVMTNDLGEFRVFGLTPGTYLVRTDAGQSGSTALATSESEIDAVFAALAARSNQAGAAARSAARVPVPSVAVTAAPIYFPGTPAVADATPIALGAGDERDGVDFAVRKIRTAAIRGTVAMPGATAAGAPVVLLGFSTPPIAFAGFAPGPLSRDAGADGRFDLSPVPPGDYRLLVRSGVSTPGATGSRFWWASQTLHVTGDDLDLGAVNLQPGLTLSGRVTLDAPPGERGPDLSALRVELQAGLLSSASAGSRGGRVPGLRTLQPGLVRADGTFDVADLVPDEYTLALAGLGGSDANWWLRSAMWNGRDLLDEPFRIDAGRELRGVTLVLSNRHTELSGTLTTPSGASVSDLYVIAFPAESALRLPRSRRVQAVRPDSAGRFVIANLPAGNYLLCALTDVDDGEWTDPGFFDPLVSAAAPVTLADGEKKVQNLRVRGGQSPARPSRKNRETLVMAHRH